MKGGSQWIFAEDLDETRGAPGFTGYETIVKRGDLAELSARELRTRYAIITRMVSDQAELAAELSLSELTTDLNRSAQWKAIRIDLRGSINEQLATSSINALREQLRLAEAAGQPITFVCLMIDSPGGSSANTITLIEEIEGLRRDGVYVAAYIPVLARGGTPP